MNIEIHVSKDNHIALVCDKRFDAPIKEIVMDPQTLTVSVVFEKGHGYADFNCAIDPDLCDKIKNEIFCAIGYIEKGKLTAAEYVRFRVGVPY